ncbi:MAG: hypothetical protein M3P49_16840 [Actinomycetota bacterium]|nr:hypothetical protein [Actinomycetota bacterium]
MSTDRVTRSVLPRAPELGEASPKHDAQAELLAAAEEVLAWLRDCSPMSQDERWDREADLRVRLRRAIRDARRCRA